MALFEITWAYNKIKEGREVTIFFTRHYGHYDHPYENDTHKDNVFYASGLLQADEVLYIPNTPKKIRLKGRNLTVSINTDNPGEMIKLPKASFDVDIYPEDGTISYLQKSNGIPVGNTITIHGTQVNDTILTGTDGTDVVVVGVQIK